MRALMIAGGVSLFFSLIVTPFLINWLHAHGIGQHIRDDGPERHQSKAGTPTMGGICIVAGGVTGYLAAHIVSGTVFTYRGMLCIAVLILAGVVGAIDDYIKIRNKRNLGLNKTAKIVGQVIVAVAFVVAGRYVADLEPVLTLAGRDSVHTNFPFTFTVPVWVWIVACVFIIIATANAVNLTDGLDGLAAGSGAFAFSAMGLIAFWEWRHAIPFSHTYDVFYALDLAVVAISLVSACAGFLWWNASPAQIFMGDTGSLAIGAALAALAISLDTALLLPIIGGIFVIETLSVILQVFCFRVFHRRVFRMAPLHHHFELGGWPETTVIVRFWILAGLLMVLGLTIFYSVFQSATTRV